MKDFLVAIFWGAAAIVGMFAYAALAMYVVGPR
jgi:hypothetical protein